MAAAQYLLGEIRIYSLNARNPLRGQGQQPLHSDVPRVHATDWRVVNSMVMLDDMTRTTARPASSRVRTSGSRSTCPTSTWREVTEIRVTPEDRAIMPTDPTAPHPRKSA